jgi:hypothetical protein
MLGVLPVQTPTRDGGRSMTTCPECDSALVRGICRSCGYSQSVAPKVQVKREPSCLRCGIVVPQAKELYTLCRECLAKDFADLTAQVERLKITAPFTRKEKRDGQGDRPAGDSGPSAGTLSHIRGIVERVTDNEVPF